MLTLAGVQASYGASRVLFDVSLKIGEGQVVTLLGRNGMGKTTTVKCMMGLLPAQGEITFNNHSLTRLAPERIARLGLGLVPEGRQVFPTLTVRENLIATAANRLGRAAPWTLDAITQLFPRLGERAGQMAATLSGGEQQMLAIGRALMTNPSLLILDEATEGLAPVIRAEIWAVLERLKRDGQSILLIDKNLSVLKRLADRHYIIEKGRIVWSGTGPELTRDADKVQAYIGV
jgi:branched-chain amino acid transport system ATP-binding protein